MNLSVLWEALSLLQKVYWVIAVASTLIFLIQLFMTFMGHDGDDLDGDHGDTSEMGHGDGIDIFSVKSILSFLMFFGWSGLAAISLGMNIWWTSLGISFLVGIIMMFVTAWALMLLIKLQSNGVMDIKTAIGKTGEVYLTIPPNKTAIGKVQIIVNNSYKTLDALTEDDEEIKTGALIEVVEVVGDTLIVERKR